MKKIYFLVLALCFLNNLNAQIINIPDANFKAKLLGASTTNDYAKNLLGNFFKIDANNNGEIEESEALNVSYLDVKGSQYTKINSLIGILKFSNLKYLNCLNNEITSLNLTNLALLEELNCTSNKLNALIVSGLVNLKMLTFENNQIVSLNLDTLISLENLRCGSNLLTDLNISNNKNLKDLFCSYNNFTTLNGNNLPKLESLIAARCSYLTSVNLLGSNNIKKLEVNECAINSLDLTGLVNLESINCNWNKITQLDAKDLKNLVSLTCNNNHINSLNVKELINLRWLSCESNELTSLDLTGVYNLGSLLCSVNKIDNLINLKNCIDLTQLHCSGNNLYSLDVSGLDYLTTLECSSNSNLVSLFIKSNSSLSTNGNWTYDNFQFAYCPNLKYICANENQIYYTKQHMVSYGYTNCEINSYCTFRPVGDFYTINGKIKFDNEANGCDETDPVVSNLKFKITSLSNLISNSSGNYTINVNQGSYTIVPLLENNDYFTITPKDINVTFPTTSKILTQDFCITIKNPKPDLEISLLPLNSARPGFNSSYKVIYKNKGNVIQSGTVNLDFQDAVLDLITANPTVTAQTTNNLSWSFANLKPFETREIAVTLKVNTPTETPAVNNGDILKFIATIASPGTDETPNDNIFTLNQTVVGSYDPNDKTCLEGTIITPSLIGEYVHYMIRFENTGTYQAQNIVVKDMIDLSKFDISTLIPTSSSHSFVTKISEGNKVEFIFENINLPFDDATNDGYVAFKIKTKPTLKVGDSFTNDANIYFDYNFPILTNKATSKFQTTLDTSDFEFSNYFTLYPNPASDVLNINAVQAIQIQSLAIYDFLGQLVIAVPNAKSVSNIDVSKLRTGTYFIKVKSDKGSSSMKFIKK